MNSFVMFAIFALAAVANCEAPGGYNYNRPSFGGGVSAGGSSISSGGNYQQEAVGGNTNEGLNVDPQLLDQIRQILLQEESKNGGGSAGGAGGRQPSSQYGAPQPQYGPPQQQQANARVVGIVLENTIPSIQVAQYRSQSQSAGGVAGGFSGYPSGPSSNFGVAPQVNAPSSNYGAPAPSRPSSSYGTPY